ncbi:MAG TPA: acetyl-CoA hydrolase/transferase C-terminal domain-containing protein [Jatrophihabitans sp.]|jgi:acyl-CoA hydrolase|nr:acetyl-CoA hydrolase/transferase C-terminal domain-containing protein [Jatrophihabitans sp.]
MRMITEANLAAVLGRVTGVPRVVASGNFATPAALLGVLDKVVAEYRLFMLNAHADVPTRPEVTLETPFVGPSMRGRPNLRYFPARLSLVPHLLSGPLPPDIALLHTSTPHNGTVSLGTEVNVLPAAIEAVRSRGGLVLAQVNTQMPYTYGDGVLTVEEIDYGIDVDVPLLIPPQRKADEVAGLIGEQVAQLVPDGATLQLGIGAVPDAVLSALTPRSSLRVWSEMFSDGVLALERAGALEQDVPVRASFVFGSKELYEWVDRNPRVRMLRTEKTNSPGLIAKHPLLMSINSALQVDLYGQANANRVRGAIYSGFGGQTDFVVGALHSAGGKAVIALPSWHTKTQSSTVVPLLAGPVTSFQHSYIVSEHGAAAIWGRDADAQARQLIDEVAHPRVRDGLRAAAHDIGLRP